MTDLRNTFLSNTTYVLAMTACLFALTTQADIYKWLDDDGNMQFSDEKPDNQDAVRVRLESSLSIAGKEKRNTPDTGNKIISHDIGWSSHNSMLVKLKYHYTGEFENAYISVITANDGKSTGHWSYRPAKLEAGTHEAEVHVGINSDAPDEYCAEELIINMYASNTGTFHEAIVPYRKCWQKKLVTSQPDREQDSRTSQ